MRKYLGVLAGAAALCAMSWAQAPTPAPAQTPAPTQTPAPAQTQAPAPAEIPTPPGSIRKPVAQYPRLELFGGGTYAEAGFFNSGHWAGLSGWDASLGLNGNSWLGFIIEGGQYFGTSKIPTGTQAPFPSCGGDPSFCPATSPTFGVRTKEYNVLFGAQFSRRKYERWTPFGEILYGHQGTRGQATAVGTVFTEIGTGRAEHFRHCQCRANIGSILWPGKVAVFDIADPLTIVEYRGPAAMERSWIIKEITSKSSRRRELTIDDGGPAVAEQIELVAVVGIEVEMPIEMLGKQRGQHRDIAYSVEICSLVARYLDDGKFGAARIDVGYRDPDIAGKRHLAAEPSKDMRDQRGGRALPFGSGDADRPNPENLRRTTNSAAR